jgi:radical SAM superfamily enzyme YgiQ (UPF0313 family)
MSTRAARGLKILLVEPSNETILTGSGGTTPLWPCVLSALTPEGHEIDFVQCSFERLTEERIGGSDLVGISCRTDSANHAYQLGDTCRKLGVPCVMGGIHPFIRPEEAKAHCDSVVLGEAENAWRAVLDDVKAGALKEFYRPRRPEPDEIQSPDLSVIRKYSYAIENVIETVRGCPFNCSFCSATLYSGRTYRYKPIDRVIQEIESWGNRSSLALFADLNVASNFNQAKDLFRELRPYKLMWWGNASVDIGSDDELLRLMSESGCAYIGLGFESISEENLKEMNKRHNIKYNYEDLIAKLHDHNIDVFGNFIFGLDGDTNDVFERTVEFAIRAGIDFPVFEILAPYPATKVYESLKEQGRLLSEDWSRYTRSDVVFAPKNMTEKELIEGLFWSYRTAYSNKELTRRAVARWRGVKRSIYNVKILSHFGKQIDNVKAYHSARRPSVPV